MWMFHPYRTMGKCSKIERKFLGTREEFGGRGKFREKKNANVTNATLKCIYVRSMQEVSSKSENGKVFKNGGKILVGRGRIRQKGGISRKKMQTSQMPSQNESVYEVSSKSDVFYMIFPFNLYDIYLICRKMYIFLLQFIKITICLPIICMFFT